MVIKSHWTEDEGATVPLHTIIKEYKFITQVERFQRFVKGMPKQICGTFTCGYIVLFNSYTLKPCLYIC